MIVRPHLRKRRPAGILSSSYAVGNRGGLDLRIEGRFQHDPSGGSKVSRILIGHVLI